MSTCTRFSQTTRRQCRRKAAVWPGQRLGPGQPEPGWPDLPRAVACWGHLTDTERARCKEARRRHQAVLAEEWRIERERLARDAAERRAAGIPDPPVWQPRPCVGACISEWKDSGGSDDRDGAMVSCARCDEFVCISCGRTRVDQAMLMCGTCYDAVPWAEDDIQDVAGPDPAGMRTELNALAGQIVALGGGPGYPWVQTALNRRMGIGQRNQATSEQLHRGIEYARNWVGLLRS